MFIKNKINVKIFILLLIVEFSFCAVKDLTFPGYHRIHYPFQIDAYSSHLTGIIFSDIPEKRNTRVKTDYGNRYSVDLQLNSTLIKHKNGVRIYSTN